MEALKEIKIAEELNKKGIIFIQTKQEVEALKYFNKAIEEDSNYLEPYYNKAMVYIASEKFDEAIKCFDIILRKDSNQGEAYFEKANVLFFNKNNVKDAMELYNKAVFLGIKNETIYFYLGLCAQALDSKEDALRWIERAIRMNEKRTDFILTKAGILIELARYLDAEKSYDKVLMLDADNEEAYHFKTIILGEQGKYADAFEVLKTGEELIGERVIFEYDRVLLLEKQGKFNEAFNSIEKGLQIDADNALLLEKKGSLLILLERGPEAKAVLDKVSELEPGNLEACFSKASLCLMLQEFDEASTLFEDIIEKGEENNPYRINSYYYKALTLKTAGKTEEAEEAYNFALKNYNILSLDYPYDVQLNLLKANTLRDIGQYKEAEELYEYVIDLNKKMPEAYLNRAKNLIYLGKTVDAKNAIEAALKVNPAYKAVIELDEALKKYMDELHS